MTERKRSATECLKLTQETMQRVVQGADTLKALILWNPRRARQVFEDIMADREKAAEYDAEAWRIDPEYGGPVVVGNLLVWTIVAIEVLGPFVVFFWWAWENRP